VSPSSSATASIFAPGRKKAPLSRGFSGYAGAQSDCKAFVQHVSRSEISRHIDPISLKIRGEPWG